MSTPEVCVRCHCEEVPEILGRMQQPHLLEVHQPHLALVFGEHHVVGPKNSLLFWAKYVLNIILVRPIWLHEFSISESIYLLINHSVLTDFEPTSSDQPNRNIVVSSYCNHFGLTLIR